MVELDCDSLHLGNGKQDTPKRTGLGAGVQWKEHKGIAVGRARGLEEEDNIKASRAQGCSKRETQKFKWKLLTPTYFEIELHYVT